MNLKEEINGLPKNDYEYMVWTYGVAAKLPSNSQIPQIQVILKRIDLENEIFVDNKHDVIAYISLSELDIVRIGSCWKNRRYIKKIWDKYEKFQYAEKVSFTFDFISNAPSSVTYNESVDSLGNSISNLYPIIVQNSEKYLIKFLNKTKYTKLLDVNGYTVLIPAVELFVSTYTPQNKEIKQRLLKYNLDEAIDKYIDFSGNKRIDEATYQIGLKNKMEDSNIKFLAYAKFNQLSRKRISSLYASLEYDEGNKIGSYAIRYPTVLPYHPKFLYLEDNDGIWLNDKTFLIYRVNTMNLPSDMEVKALIKNEIYIPKETTYKNKPIDEKIESRNNEENDDSEIPDDNNTNNEKILGIDSGSVPTKRKSVDRLKTQVQITDDKKPIVTVETKNIVVNELVEDENSENIIDKKEEVYVNGQKGDKSDFDLSDAELGSSDDNSKQIQYMKNYQDIETSILFSTVKEILNKFKEKNFIANFQILDENISEVEKYSNTTFFNTLKHNGYDEKDLQNSWYKLQLREDGVLNFLGYRKYLLIKIELEDGKYCYLMEIGKKESESGYLGVIFKQDVLCSSMSINKLVDFLKNIVSNKGNYSKKVSKESKKRRAVDLNVFYEKYKHKFDKKNKKYINLGKTIKSKIKLLKRKS